MLRAPQLSVREFAGYHRAQPDTRARIVREKRETLENANGHPYGAARYAKLRRAIVQCHILHDNIAGFRRGLPDILLSIDLRYRYRCNVVAHSYADWWETLDATPFEGRRVVLDMAGLAVSINAELGVQYADGREQLLKLWFGSSKPPSTCVPVVSGLMHMAGRQHGWPQSWTKGFLDIERRSVLALSVDEATAEPLLLDTAGDFMHRWGS